MNLDTVSFTVTAPGASPGTAMAAVAGDTAVVRNSRKDALVLCLAMWVKAQGAGITTMVWPSGHDLVRGVRQVNVANQISQKVPWGSAYRFRAQDPITMTQIGSAVAGDVELAHLLMYYEDLPGVDAHMINLAMLRSRGVASLTVQDTITPTAASAYSGPRFLNAGSDLLKADTEYAVLGGTVQVDCGALTLRGVDTGNLRVSIPGESGDENWNNNFFVHLSEIHDLNCIPVINSANRGGIIVEVVQDENTAAVPFHLNLVELNRPFQADMAHALQNRLPAS